MRDTPRNQNLTKWPIRWDTHDKHKSINICKITNTKTLKHIYIGRRVSVIVEEGRNKGLTITGTLGINDGGNPDFSPEEVPYSIVFDKRFKEEEAYLLFPDEDIEFLYGPAPKQPPTNRATPKKETSRTTD